MPLDPINFSTNSAATVDFFNNLNGLESTSSEASVAAALNFETFLTLLVTELENQDPLDPLDNKEMTAQLAQFSSLEQNIQQNKFLEKIAGRSDFSQQSVALSYIGKDALIPGSVTASDGNANVSLNYNVESAVTNVNVEILNSAGEIIRNLEGKLSQGRNETIWDSKDDDGNAVEAGLYTFRVSGIAPDGDEVNIKEFTYGHVHSLEGTGDDVSFTAEDGRNFTLEDILLVREAAKDPTLDETAS